MSTPAERVNETKKDNAFSREGGVLVTQSAHELIAGHENTNLLDLQADITLRIATVQDIDCLQYIEKTSNIKNLQKLVTINKLQLTND